MDKMKKMSIDELKLDKSVINVLKENNVYEINELITKTKPDLRKMELANRDISSIEIKLQLEGLDLKGNNK